MIIKTELLKDSCEKILGAISKSKLDDLRDCLELLVEDSHLHLNITNNEYFVSVNIPLDHNEAFHATINAQQFLKLVAQTSNAEIELANKDANLIFKSGNGRYKLPLIYDDNEVMTLKPINLYNVTVSTEINSDYLHSILNINSKDVAKRSFGSPVQQMYYLDQEGCITFASGACINNYNASNTPFRILLNDSIVKLFKLFDKEALINFQLGYDIDGTKVQPKLKLSYENIEITSILNNDDNLINSVPVDAIRKKSNKILNNPMNTVTIYKNDLLTALNRLEIFNSNKIVKLNITDTLNVSDLADVNVEEIAVQSSSITSRDKVWLVDSDKLKTLLNNCIESNLVLYLEEDSILIRRNNVINIIPTYEQE